MKVREEKKGYKSPLRKLVKFFEQSRDQWKAKCIAAKKQVKGLKNRLRYVEQRKVYWQHRAKALESELVDMKARSSELKRKVEGLFL